MTSRALSFVVAAVLVIACEPQIAVELCDVADVEDARIDAGHRLTVLGQRFLLGHPCTFVLRGRWHRPGEPGIVATREIEAEAISTERAEAIVTEEILRGLGGRATFVGSLEVRFRAASIPGGTVHGTLAETTIDFVPVATGSRGGDVRDIETALGARFADGSDDGVELAEVDEAGLFGAMGLAPGDRIVARGPMSVLLPTDLALGALPESELRFSVLRGGERFDVRAPAAPTVSGVPGARVIELGALIVAIALVLSARGSARAPTPAGPAHLVIAALVSIGLWRAMALGWIGDAASLLGLGVLVTLLSAAALRSRPAMIAGGLAAAALVVLVLSAAATAGTTDLAVLAEPSNDPRTWQGLASALAPAAMLMPLATSLGPPDRPLPRLFDALALGVVCAILAILFFGGSAEGGAGAASLAVRTTLLATLGLVGREAFAKSARLEIVAALGVLVGAPLAAFVMLSSPLTPETASIVAETVGVLALGLVGRLLTLRLRGAPSPLAQLEL